MKNAVLYLAEFINMLPAAEAPAHTENREGFYHVSSVNGNESKATLHMIIRDHNKQSFAKRKEFITVLVEFFNRKYGENTVSAEIKDSYYNMLDVIKEHIDIVERAKKQCVKPMWSRKSHRYAAEPTVQGFRLRVCPAPTFQPVE